MMLYENQTYQNQYNLAKLTHYIEREGDILHFHKKINKQPLSKHSIYLTKQMHWIDIVITDEVHRQETPYLLESSEILALSSF